MKLVELFIDGKSAPTRKSLRITESYRNYPCLISRHIYYLRLAGLQVGHNMKSMETSAFLAQNKKSLCIFYLPSLIHTQTAPPPPPLCFPCLPSSSSSSLPFFATTTLPLFPSSTGHRYLHVYISSFFSSSPFCVG